MNTDQTTEVDEAAVEEFLAQMAGVSDAQRQQIKRHMALSTERMKGPNGYVSIATMRAVAERL